MVVEGGIDGFAGDEGASAFFFVVVEDVFKGGILETQINLCVISDIIQHRAWLALVGNIVRKHISHLSNLIGRSFETFCQHLFRGAEPRVTVIIE